jgi:hypothetical protein
VPPSREKPYHSGCVSAIAGLTEGEFLGIARREADKRIGRENEALALAGCHGNGRCSFVPSERDDALRGRQGVAETFVHVGREDLRGYAYGAQKLAPSRRRRSEKYAFHTAIIVCEGSVLSRMEKAIA